jgi:hypothetical protein
LQERRSRRTTDRFMTEVQDRYVSAGTYAAVLESERGRPTERNPSRLESDDTVTTTLNNVLGAARASRTTARRDSSTGLAANYSEIGQRVSEYRHYESPHATTSGRQMSQQRLLYHASVVDTAQGSTQQSSNSNATSSSSHPPGEHIEFASLSSSASNAFGGPQSQSNAPTNNYASFDDYTHTTCNSPMQPRAAVLPNLTLYGTEGTFTPEAMLTRPHPWLDQILPSSPMVLLV